MHMHTRLIMLRLTHARCSYVGDLNFELRKWRLFQRRTMPKRTRNTRKKEPVASSGVSTDKIATIAEDAAIDSFIDDFSVQTAALTKQALKQFEKSAKLVMGALPQKTSIPKEILKMELSEFIERGGSFQAVWDSLKNERQNPQPQPPDPEQREVLEEVTSTEQDVGPTEDMFVTPALSTRSQRARGRTGQTTAKRKPKPLEEIKVQAYSNISGSPVDEKTLLQLHSDELLGKIRDKIMEATAKFPQKWRSKLVQSFRDMKAQAALKEDDVFVTPALKR